MSTSTAMAIQPLDTIRQFETPEGVMLDLRLAGALPRALAWLLDFLIRFGIYLVLFIPLAFLGKAGFGIFLIIAFMLEWGYPFLFEAINGRTPGKKALGLRVLQDDGAPLGWSAALIRNLLRVADFFPLLYAVGLVSMLVNTEFKRLGDLVAGSVVVHDPPPEARGETPGERALPLPVPLNLAEQSAVLDFAERAPGFSEARREELAELLRPMHGRDGALAVRSLLAYANQLSGRT